MGRMTKTQTFNYDDRYTAGPEEDLDYEDNLEAVLSGLRNIVKSKLSADALMDENEDPLQLSGLFDSIIQDAHVGYIPFEADDLFEKMPKLGEAKRRAAFEKIAEGIAELVDLTIDYDSKGLAETVEILEERGELN